MKKETGKNVFSFLLRLALSFGLLAWIFSKIDIQHTWSVIRSADLGYMLWAGVVFFFINILILLRWDILVRALKLDMPFWTIAKWFFIGLFCNLFLPTSVGGDVVKTIGLSRQAKQKPKVFASVVLDRLCGFAGIVIVAAVMFVVGYRQIPDRAVGLSIVAMTLFSLTITAVLFSHRIYSFCCRLFDRWPKFKKSIMDVHYDIVLMKGKVGHGILAIAMSCVAQIVSAYVFFVIAKALHQDVDFFYFMIFSPLVCVATALPSIGGLGVREMGWVYLLSKVGVAQGVAVGISLINFLFMVLVGLIGGVMYVVTFFDRRVQSHQTDPGVRLQKP
ncbi:MAG: lysylphosphatidylglycerol synthase transmembrane domain-containing protein [Patescibacteria group bacterium]